MADETSVYDALLETIKGRRNIRKFRPDPVPDELIERIIEAARWAPSGANSQPWEFVVVKDDTTKKAIADIFVEHSRRKMSVEITFPYRNPASLIPKYLGAAAIIIVCSDPRLKKAYPLGGRESNLNVSMGAAMQNMHLAIRALGLASGWGTIHGGYAQKELRKLLGIPTPLRIMEVVPVGYADMQAKPRYCRQVRDILHWNHFDKGKLRKGGEIEELIATRPVPDIYARQSPET